MVNVWMRYNSKGLSKTEIVKEIRKNNISVQWTVSELHKVQETDHLAYTFTRLFSWFLFNSFFIIPNLLINSKNFDRKYVAFLRYLIYYIDNNLKYFIFYFSSVR